MTDQQGVSGDWAHVEFSTPNRNALGYRELVERLAREGDPTMTGNLTIGHGTPLKGASGGIAGPDRRLLGEVPSEYVIIRPPHRPILIALTSPAMGSGKSTIANHLVAKHGFVLLKFAGPLKAMARSLLAEMGDDNRTIERRVEGDLKETEIPALQCTARQLLQRIGTEFGRVQLHQNVWADVTRDRAAQLLGRGRSVVIDDLRYLNELAAVKWVGGIPVRVTRPGATITSAHSSEGELTGERMTTLENRGSITDLHELVDNTLAHLLDTQ